MTRSLALPLSIATAGLFLATTILQAVTSSAPALLLINETPSVPRGLYLRRWESQPRLGRLVTIAQPQAARAYLASLQVPADLRLLKRVAARGGEVVCAEAGALRTPRRRVAVARRDRRGVPLPTWRGCRPLAADELMLLGDRPTSFDGRYFGPVTRSAVEASYTAVVRW